MYAGLGIRADSVHERSSGQRYIEKLAPQGRDEEFHYAPVFHSISTGRDGQLRDNFVPLWIFRHSANVLAGLCECDGKGLVD